MKAPIVFLLLSVVVVGLKATTPESPARRLVIPGDVAVPQILGISLEDIKRSKPNPVDTNGEDDSGTTPKT